MGWGFLGDIADAVTDTAEGAWDAATNAAEGAWDTATDTAGNAGGWLGSAIAAGAEVVDTATFGLAGEALETADDYVFDTVDYVTGGAVNLDFDDGKFTVGAGFDGLAGFGASIGEDGISADGSVPGFDLGLSLGDAGLGLSGSAGIDFGPLPYAEGHLEVAPNGDVLVDGELQGTIPTPLGLLSGEVSGGFVQTQEGWGAYVDADGTLTLPSGTSISAGVEAAYTETAEGSELSVGVEGSVSMPGVGSVGGSVEYDRVEVDGDVVEGFHAEVEASGFGGEIRAEADYVGVEIDGVEASTWETDVDVTLPALGELTDAAMPEPEPAPRRPRTPRSASG
jgi:hypothetical protein